MTADSVSVPDHSAFGSARKAGALEYAAWGGGIAVFPCQERAKEPATRRGFYDATTNPALIERWWKSADYNVAVATGIRSGLWVLDVDGPDGRASLAALQAAHGEIPSTVTWVTTRGRHLWFRCDAPVPCSAGRVGIGLDIRGDGGYCLAPPSIHPDGHLYHWASDSADALAVAPEWLVRLTRTRPKIEIPRPVMQHAGSPGGYGAAALDRECAALAATPPGGASFRLHQLIAGGELDGERVVAGLIAACHRNGLAADGMRSVLATIASGRAGLLHPRSRSAQ